MPRLKPAERRAVLEALEARYGGRGTALHYRNPFELLIAVLLSAQTTDKMVNIVTAPFFEAYPTPEAMAKLTPEEIQPWIARIGFSATKARHIAATARILVEQHGGEVPADREALEALPGVGRKTANVVLSNVFDVPAIAVDTHVFRVSNRIGLAEATNVVETERQLEKAIPKADWSEAHHWLIWHGREICKAPTPKCEVCMLTPWCRYFKAHGLPKRGRQA